MIQIYRQTKQTSFQHDELVVVVLIELSEVMLSAVCLTRELTLENFGLRYERMFCACLNFMPKTTKMYIDIDSNVCTFFEYV